MEDWVKSSAGGEEGDSSFSSRPIRALWNSTPLPLTQVEPLAFSLQRKFGLRSLQSSCLSIISANLDQLSPASFFDLPNHLVRKVIHRITYDRGYDFSQVTDGQGRVVMNSSGHGFTIDPRPDAATLWSLCAAIDPELHLPNEDFLNLSSDHVLPLPVLETLQSLAPKRDQTDSAHPLIEIPKAFEQCQSHMSRELKLGPRYHLLTTLSLNGNDGLVDDSNVFHLKWCTQLSALWLNRCAVSDDGIRMLASALHLPGPRGSRIGQSTSSGRGMWRLRAWYLPGCKRVTDRSLKSVARWPGLVLLDLRDTSCTTAAKQIFNAQSRLLFHSQNADFQSCPQGLAATFSANAAPSSILGSLCATLIKPEKTFQVSDEESSAGRSRWWLALHVTSSRENLRPEWLPEAPTNTRPTGTSDKFSQSRAYRGNGIGQIYGASVYKVKDEAADYRWRLKTAMRLEAEDEGLSAKQKPYWEELKSLKGWQMKRKWDDPPETQKAKRQMKGYNPNRGRGRGRGRGRVGGRGGWSGASTWNQDSSSDERSKAFVQGSTKCQTEWLAWEDSEGEQVKGDRSLMLVRMVCDHWQELVWHANATAPQATDLRTVTLASSTQNVTVPPPQPRKAGLVESILDVAQPQSTRSQVIASSPLTEAQSSPKLFSASQNPFRQKRISTNPSGIRPLLDSSLSHRSIPRLTSSGSSDTEDAHFPSTPPVSSSPVELDNTTETDVSGFRKPAIKSRFGGNTQDPIRRSGMKMFGQKPT